jgi:predicted house-cleaning noncanonical NTP pyrophosphatase (MazG superfamily)|tara:strand:- start:872 stop:1189 length:318 start_codon:yes stop_codon:yes gene_type:complete
MKKEYNKLVRDRIPEIIEEAGNHAQVHQPDAATLRHYTFKKLREEVEEFIENPCAEEAADVMEIMNFICHRMGIHSHTIVAYATAKRVERGGFEMGLVLEWVDEK